jgi:hypothetical protein
MASLGWNGLMPIIILSTLLLLSLLLSIITLDSMWLSIETTVRSESRYALIDMLRRFGCQYRSCRCSVLLFHCIQLLNSG